MQQEGKSQDWSWGSIGVDHITYGYKEIKIS